MPEVRVVDGKATFARRHKTVHADGTRARTGQTASHNNECLQIFYQHLYSECPLYLYGNSTVYKHGLPAIKSYLYNIINNKMFQGYCNFHPSTFAPSKFKTCQSVNEREISLGVPLNAKYYWFPQTLPVSFTGDGGPVKNAQRNVSNMSLAFFKICGFVRGVTHSLYSGVCVLVSSLSESCDELQYIIQLIGDSVKDETTVAIKCVEMNFYLCLHLKRWNAGDWKWCFQMHNFSIGCSANFSLTEICHWKMVIVMVCIMIIA